MSPVAPAVITAPIEAIGSPPPTVANLLTDGEVAAWLGRHPEFFDEHADLLSEVRIRHPHGGRAISLVEKQVAVLREKNKALEQRMADLIRIGQENDIIGDRLQRLTRDLLKEADATALPALLAAGLTEGFAMPQVAVRLWGIAGLAEPFGRPVSAEQRRRTDDLTQPYCGPSHQAEPASWLPGDGADTESLAMVSLRVGARPQAFGLLVMGSPDAGRFQAGMGTAFLERLAEVASASLSRLLAAHGDA